MYAPVIGRWMSTDPYGQFYSPYLGMGNNPVIGIDPDGGDCETCPGGKEYDVYRNDDALFNYEDGVGAFYDIGSVTVSSTYTGSFFNGGYSGRSFFETDYTYNKFSKDEMNIVRKVAISDPQNTTTEWRHDRQGTLVSNLIKESIKLRLKKLGQTEGYISGLLPSLRVEYRLTGQTVQTVYWQGVERHNFVTNKSIFMHNGWSDEVSTSWTGPVNVEYRISPGWGAFGQDKTEIGPFNSGSEVLYNAPNFLRLNR
jgi:hypothetical protein